MGATGISDYYILQGGPLPDNGQGQQLLGDLGKEIHSLDYP
jgi:hypothetical protein